MKALVITAVILFAGLSPAVSQQYKVSLSAPQYHSGITYLTYYYGKNMNVVDSTAFDGEGKAVFSSQKTLDPGVYSIVFPGKTRSYDFLIGGEQNLDITVKDSTNPIGNTIVEGSGENELFQSYQEFVARAGAGLSREREAFMSSKTKADSSLHEENYRKLNKQLNDYRDSIVENFPESMLAVLLKTMKDPPAPGKSPVTREDTLANYQYYKQHYWDGVTFRDDRIIKTPFFLPKLERYFRQVVNQNPDSVIREADYLVLLSRTNEKMYRFLLNWLTDEYYNPKIMGQDKVFVHLFEKYHSQGVSTWLSDAQHKSISERAYMVMSNLIGEPAAHLTMTDISGKKTDVYDIKSKFTIVSFWDPTCGHCQKQMPQLDSMYKAKWKSDGVKIVGVLTDNSVKDKWVDFINTHKLTEWVNIYQTAAQAQAIEKANLPSYQQLYDVIQTPTIYLLDEDKRIIAKKLTLEQMDELIAQKLKNETAR